MNDKVKKVHDEAWQMLKDEGISLGKMVKIRSGFASMNKDEFPFIVPDHEQNGTKFCSSLPEIKSLIFDTKEEANLANSIVFAMGDKFEINEFTYQFRMILRILQIESRWN